jgi:hypothetical protein
MKIPFISKKSFKRRNKKCAICNEADYDLLDSHRWRVPGSENGKYTTDNTVSLCVKCHRLLHKGRLKILNICNSTRGKVIIYIDENGEEQFNTI